MKVAILLFFRAPLGGLQDNVHTTAKMLVENGHDVTIFCPPGKFHEKLAADGLSARDLTGDAADQLSFDLVHAHPGDSRIFGQNLAKRLGCPLVMTYHGRWIDGIAGYYADCARILVVSRAVRDAIISVAPAAEHRIEYMPNAVKQPSLMRPTINQQQNGDVIRVLVASRFDLDKKPLVDMMIAMWEEQSARGVTCLSWDLAGDGTLLSSLKEASFRIFGEAGPVIFHGWLDRHALEQLLSMSGISVAPGRSAIEAMASGLPVIPLGSAGCFGIVTEDNIRDAEYCNFGGFGLKTPAQPGRVIDDLVNLAQDTNFRRTIGEFCSRYISDNFDISHHHARLEQIYYDAIKAQQAENRSHLAHDFIDPLEDQREVKGPSAGV